MQNGELPRNHQPKLAVVMIGANDLTAAYVQCGTWDSNSYYNAAASIAQQCAPSTSPHHLFALGLLCLDLQLQATLQPCLNDIDLACEKYLLVFSMDSVMCKRFTNICSDPGC